MLTEKIQKELMGMDVAFLVDATYSLNLPESHLDYGIRPLVSNKKLVGTALTVRIETVKDKKLANFDSYSELLGTKPKVPYPVIVVEVPEKLHNYALWGDGGATLASSSGFIGYVIDGAIRDINILKTMDIITFYRTIAPGYIAGRVADVGNPVTVGSRTIFNGDIIVGDDDGVIVIKPENIEDTINRVKIIYKWEEAVHKGFRNGLYWKDAIKNAGEMPMPY